MVMISKTKTMMTYVSSIFSIFIFLKLEVTEPPQNDNTTFD